MYLIDYLRVKRRDAISRDHSQAKYKNIARVSTRARSWIMPFVIYIYRNTYVYIDLDSHQIFFHQVS